MTTHVAAWVPGDEREPSRLYWASDRKVTMGDSRRYERFFKPAPKAASTERLWVAGAGAFHAITQAQAKMGDCENVRDFLKLTIELGDDKNAWPQMATDSYPEFMVCDSEGLHVINDRRDILSARAMCPVATGSGTYYAIGAALALLDGHVATARRDWLSIVERAVRVAGDCDEGTAGIESGVWRPGPVVYQLEAEDVAVPA